MRRLALLLPILLATCVTAPLAAQSFTCAKPAASTSATVTCTLSWSVSVAVPRDTVLVLDSIKVPYPVHDTVPKPYPVYDTVKVPAPYPVYDTINWYCTAGACSTTKPLPPVVTPPPPPPPVDTSTPPPVVVPSTTFLNSPALQAAWAKFKVSGNPWYALVKSNCAATGTSAERYGDDGGWCALLAVREHDTTAARKAIVKVLAAGMTPSTSGGAENTFREQSGWLVILTNWLLPYATPVQADSMLLERWNWMNWQLNSPVAYTAGIRLGDGDQNTTTYLTASLTERLLRGTKYASHWEDSTSHAAGATNTFVGNLAGAVPGSLGAWVHAYVGQCDQGGEWNESSEYNPGTRMLAMLGIAALRSFDGVDSLSDMQPCFTLGATRVAWDWTPDLAAFTQWGDEQQPHNLYDLYLRTNEAGMLAGVTTGEASALAHGMLNRLVAKYGPVGYNTAEPIIDGPRMLAVFDPSSPADTTHPAGAWVAAGHGHLWIQEGQSLAFLECQPPTGEDHQVGYVCSHQLYRNGEWAINQPIGYGGPFNLAPMVNGAVYAGFATMASKTFEGADSGSGRYCVRGSTSGPLYSLPYYQPPPAFLTLGHTTSCFAQVSGSDVLITKDSVVMTPPAMPGHWRSADSLTILANPGWYVARHPQTVPTRAGNVWTWLTPKGQTVTMSVFSDGTISADSLLDEKTLYPSVATNITLGKQLRLRTTGHVLTTVTVVGTPMPVASVVGGVTVKGTMIAVP